MEAIVLYLECFFVDFLWIKRFDEAGFSKQKPEAINAFELLFQGFKRIDGKIRRHNRKGAAWLDLCLKKISYHPAAIIIPNA